MKVRRGQMVGLVGRNGAGKSTLAKIIGGLYRPDRGVVMWNGMDLGLLPPDLLRDKIAFVFQDFVRYLLRARDNVILGRWEATGDHRRIMDALEGAGMAEEVRSWPDGMETVLGDTLPGGRELSLGQWQRLALSRALFRRAELLILDEPTSSLDPIAERCFLMGLKQGLAAQAVVVISHRLSTVRHADYVYVLEGGEIVEQGQPMALERGDGVYAGMVASQGQRETS